MGAAALEREELGGQEAELEEDELEELEELLELLELGEGELDEEELPEEGGFGGELLGESGTSARSYNPATLILSAISGARPCRLSASSP
jgi:hypothetical protein